MAMSPEQLSSTLKHLKRSPAPRVPVNNVQQGPIDIGGIKLRKTGNKEILIEQNTMATKQPDNENNSNELDSVFKKRFSQFKDMGDLNGKPATMPRIMPKPKHRKTSEGESRESTTSSSESFPGSKRDSNGNVVGVPGALKPLPSLQSIGSKPPPKPTKPQLLTMKVEKKYKNHKVIIAPKIETVKNESIIEDEDLIQEDIYDDICHADDVTDSPAPQAQQLIQEDFYDDVEQLAEVVKAELGRSSDPPSDSNPITEDFYDDLNTAGNPPTFLPGTGDGEDGEFGEDLYQPVEGAMDFDQANGVTDECAMDDEYQIPGEQGQTTQNTIQPPPPRQSSSKEDSKKKDKEREKKEKELQKKKEKDELRRKKEEEKRDKEEKKKKEEEKRFREKNDKELKKKHKLKGNEEILCKGTAKESLSGTGKELPCSTGSILEVISKDNCPSGKWLVRDAQGHFGYVPSETLEVSLEESDEIGLDEDLYECVDTFKGNAESAPPPIDNLPAPAADDIVQEIYDDTLMEDEDLYDELR